jgi:beta-lactamase regulating signal transducer with metallopeptidase domain
MTAQIVCVLHWFNPLVWLIAQKLFIEQERAADDYVINHGIKISEYAKHLIEASEKVKYARRTSLDVAAMARGTDFKDRMLCVLDPGAKRKSLQFGGNIMIAVIIFLIFMPLASLNPWVMGNEWS